MHEINLPPAQHPRYPLCGVCLSSTDYEDGVYVCEACKLEFDPQTLEASRPLGEPVCGAECSDKSHKWGPCICGASHARNWECNPCQLPEGHASEHWGGCVAPRRCPHLDKLSKTR